MRVRLPLRHGCHLKKQTEHERGILCSWAIGKLYEGGGDAHGNVSSRIDSTHFWIKPSGVKKADLSELCLMRIVAYGGGMMPTIQQIGGKLNPSVDAVHHAQIYCQNQWLQSICHTHSDYVVAHAIVEAPIRCVSTEQADIFGGHIGCLPYKDLDSWSLELELHEKGVPAVLLGHHGGLTFHKDPMKAVELAKRMEEIARKNHLARTLFDIAPDSLPDKEIAKWRKRYLKGYGQKS